MDILVASVSLLLASLTKHEVKTQKLQLLVKYFSSYLRARAHRACEAEHGWTESEPSQAVHSVTGVEEQSGAGTA